MKTALVAALLLLTGCGFDFKPEPAHHDTHTAMRHAFDSCRSDINFANAHMQSLGLPDAVQIADGDRSMIFHTPPEPKHKDIVAIACVMQELKVPVAIADEIFGARAIDGPQSTQQDGYLYRWVYHDGEGLNLTIQDRR